MSLGAWASSPYTGLFTAYDRLWPEPHDAAVEMVAATLGPRGPRAEPLIVGGAGWTEAHARGACLGEALERCEGWLQPTDERVRASYAAWPRDEPAVDPSRFVGFSDAQHASEGFPFTRLGAHTETTWVAFRDPDGEARWVPDAFAVLFAPPGEGHGVAPLISTGLAAGRLGEHPLALRGLQEVIERDALTRAWWGELDLEVIEPDDAFARLGDAIARRCARPHLSYRFYRIATPLSAHATLVTTEGEERDGFVFSTGSAVRETRTTSLEKALLEALQGRAYVRHERARVDPAIADRPPQSFAEHVLHYTLRPSRLRDTVLARAEAPEDRATRDVIEDLPSLIARLPHPPLTRLMTPASVSRLDPSFAVVKVVVPGLAPLHAHHHLAHLGHPHWRDRPLDAWLAHPPHPFA